MVKVTGIDHIVLTVADIEKSIAFYTTILGMHVIEFGNGRKALRLGNQKINLHQTGHSFEPKAHRPTEGAADLCFIVETKLETVQLELSNKGITIVEGIVQRTGATGKLKSIYIRDPDKNLIELSHYC